MGVPSGTIYPRLVYEDQEAAVAWLAEVFGFVQQDQKANPDGSLLVWLELDGGVLMVSGPGYGLRSPKELGSPTSKTNVYVQDVDAHYQRARAAGATIDRELADMPWGDRRYETIDLEGHHWHFAQSVDS